MTAIQPTSRLRLGDQASYQSVDDGAVVLMADSGQLYTCNETTGAFLARVDGVRTFSEIVEGFVDEFDIDKGTAREDLSELAGNLLDEGIIALV
ncbi:MAG: PqqD family protein [Candidatus Sedimenticola endophacoides]